MAWKDELNNAKKVFHNGTTKEKVVYIWEYYKLHIFAIVFVVCFIGSVIYNNVTAKEYVLQGIFLNTLVESETVSEMEQDFIEAYPIDTSSEEVFFDASMYYSDDSDAMETSYQTMQVLATRVAAREIDFMAADVATLYNFAYDQYFAELPEILSEEQLEAYEPYFLYYDKAVLEELSNIDYTAEVIPEIALPDPSKPELMEEPVPVMIDVSSSEKISTLYPASTKKYAFAFVVNGKHDEKTAELLEYLMLKNDKKGVTLGVQLNPK